MWYVIQTQTGKESIVKLTMENVISREAFEECRIIYYEGKRKYKGIWHVEQRRMFPGYLFVITDHLEQLRSELFKIPRMTKLLRTGEDIVPLSSKEEEFIRRLSGDSSLVTMSYGIQEGDRVIIRQGSLKGMEYTIRKIDRHKRKAFIEVELLGASRLVEVGLEIVSKV